MSGPVKPGTKFAALVMMLGFAFVSGANLGREFPRKPAVDPNAIPQARAELIRAQDQARTLTASVAVAESALADALATQARVETMTVVRYVRAKEREAAIVAEPPTEQGAAESLERAAEFERRQEARR